MTLKKFLSHNPSVTEILQYIEIEAQRIAEERKKAVKQAGVR